MKHFWAFWLAAIAAALICLALGDAAATPPLEPIITDRECVTISWAPQPIPSHRGQSYGVYVDGVRLQVQPINRAALCSTGPRRAVVTITDRYSDGSEFHFDAPRIWQRIKPMDFDASGRVGFADFAALSQRFGVGGYGIADLADFQQVYGFCVLRGSYAPCRISPEPLGFNPKCDPVAARALGATFPERFC